MAPITATGYITRTALSLGNLTIAVDPMFLLTGDSSQDAATSSGAGFALGASQMKYVWADSPYVSGKQLVLATPDNSTLDLRLQCNGSGAANTAQTYAGQVIAAIQQQTFQISLTWNNSLGDAVTNTYNCYAGTWMVAFNQLWSFGYELPLYISCPRDPTPVAGSI